VSPRVTAVTSYLVEAPVQQSFSASAVRGKHTNRSAVLVRVAAEGGEVGWGETFPTLSSPGSSLLRDLGDVLSPALIGRDPLAPGDAIAAVQRAARGMGTSAQRLVSAVDVALWDLRGRILGQSVARLLGGRSAGRFPAVATAVFYPPEADDLAARVEIARRLADDGFRAVKVKVGGLPPMRDVAHVLAIRQALSADVMVCMDANSGYLPRTALAVGRHLTGANIYWFEEPVAIDDVDGYAAIAAATDMHLAGGQDLVNARDYAPLLAAGAIHIVQPSVAVARGITGVAEIAATANAFDARYCPTGWGTSLLVAASLQVRAARASDVALPFPDLDWIEIDVTDNPLRHEIAVNPIRPVDGTLVLSDEPGLGLEVSEERVQARTVEQRTVTEDDLR
jgi:D-galactarolactone cycloisomerase